MDSVNELLRSIKTGDATAFNELYERYWSSIYKAVRYWTHDHDLAQDIAQDVFLKVWKTRSQLPDHAGKNYLFVIARNCIYDHYDRMKTFSRVQKQYFFGKEDVELPPQKEEDNKLSIELLKTFETLPPATALICKLIFLKGLKYGSVAARLGIKVQSVRNAVFDGRKTFRTKFKGLRKGL